MLTGCALYCFSDVLALPIFKQEEPQLSPENDAKLPPFQYVLCTATSPAVKLHEETLTYLNQGRTGKELNAQLICIQVQWSTFYILLASSQ